MKSLQALPFKRRLLLGFTLVALVPLALYSGLLLGILNSRLQKQADSNATAHLSEMQSKLTALLQDVDSTSAALCNNETLSRALLESGGSIQNDVYLSLYAAGNNLYSGVVLSVYDIGGHCRFTTNSTSAPTTLPVTWGVLHKALETSGPAYYSVDAIPSNDTDYSLQVAQRLQHRQNILVGYVVVSIPSKVFSSLFATPRDFGSVLLLDTTGRTVYTSHQVSDTELSALRSYLLSPTKKDFEQNNQRYYIEYDNNTRFFTVLCQPTPLTNSTLRSLQAIGLIIAIISFVLCLMVSALLSRNISHPVQQLSQAMQKVQNGQLDTHLDTKRKDELGQLTQSFNKMTQQLKNHVAQSVQQQKEVDDSQIRLMQAQLNPHFLYNTLDTIKWTAKINQIDDIANISSNLALILRQSVSSSQFVSFQQELKTIESYVDIQRIRFSGRFQCVQNVPSTLHDYLVPKLFLQPIVENAILHGLKDKQSGYIYIYAIAEDNKRLIVSVTDDGCGMDPDIVKRLSEEDSKIVEGHLGLYNVNHIIKMHYGKEYGLRASSILGIGTTMTVILPLQKGE